MSVLDASVFVNALAVEGEPGEAARDVLRRLGVLEVPAVFPAEVTSAVRRMLLAGVIDERIATDTLVALTDVTKVSHPFEPFIERIWQLRHHLTVYDAWYVALAEALDTPLFTADQQLAEAPGLRCDITVVGVA
jgi:predicted nucleic acid-binding protein